jgi:hypothetical protein
LNKEIDMSGPLSGKERRDDWALAADQERKDMKAAREARHAEEMHALKMRGQAAQYGIPAPQPRPTAPLARPVQAAPAAQPAVQPSDTQPAMLTPGEAVIPAAAAQDPKNKGLIARMVQEGRDANQAVRDLFKHFTGAGGQEIVKGAAPAMLRGGRDQQLQNAEKAAVGYADGTPAVPFPLARR